MRSIQLEVHIILEGGQLLFIHGVLDRRKPCALKVHSIETTHSLKNNKTQSKKMG